MEIVNFAEKKIIKELEELKSTLVNGVLTNTDKAQDLYVFVLDVPTANRTPAFLYAEPIIYSLAMQRPLKKEEIDFVIQKMRDSMENTVAWIAAGGKIRLF